MGAAERNLSRSTSSPATLSPRPKVSRWANVLIVIGALSLFDVTGLDRWGTPLVMLVVGVALLTRPYAWGRTLALVLMSVVLTGMLGWYFTHPAASGAPSTETVSQPLTAARAEIQLSTTVGRLDVGPGSSGNLIDGTLHLGRNDRLDRAFSTRGDTQVVRLSARQVRPGVFNFGSLDPDNAQWLIRLSPKVPLILKIATGVGESTLDLGGLKVTDLSLAVGVGNTALQLPAAGAVTASIQGGVGRVDVRIPRGVQAQVRAHSGLGAVRVLGDFQRSGDTYTSSSSAGASNRVDLQIEGGVGSITVEQAGR
jgi:hypothetical protein